MADMTEQTLRQMIAQYGEDMVQRWARGRGDVTVDGKPYFQSVVSQPEAEESLSVNPLPPPPSNLSVRVPEDQTAYGKNTAILAALRSDPLGYISDVRGQQLGAFDERYKALTDPTSPQYRNRSQANWFNLAAQLMKPTMSGSVVENLGGAFGYLGSEAAKRQDLLAALQEKRAELAQKYDIAMLNAASGMEEKRIAAEQKRRPTGFNPVTGVLTYLDTNEPVTPPPPQIGEVRKGYRFKGGDPAVQSNWEKVV